MSSPFFNLNVTLDQPIVNQGARLTRRAPRWFLPNSACPQALGFSEASERRELGSAHCPQVQTVWVC